MKVCQKNFLKLIVIIIHSGLITSQESSSFSKVCQEAKITDKYSELEGENYIQEFENNRKKFPSLQIFTINELKYLKNTNSNLINIYDDQELPINETILNKCDLNPIWKLSDPYSNEIHNTNYEDENITQRTFRINYNKIKNSIDVQTSSFAQDRPEKIQENKNNFITINKIELITKNFENYEANSESFPTLSESVTDSLPIILEEGSSLDFFIYYNCNRLNYIKEWFDVGIKIQIDAKYFIQFDYLKICSSSYKQSSNFSYLLLVLLFVLINYICNKDFLIFNLHLTIINVEEIVHLKYAEVIIIVILIITAVLVLLTILSLFYLAAYAAGFILSLISIKFLLKGVIALIFPKFDYYISNRIWPLNIKNIEIDVSLSKVIYYIFAFFILSLWLIYFNDIFLANFIAFAISYLLIKKISFNNFYLIIGLYLLVIFYDFFYIFNNGLSYGDYFSLSSVLCVNIPVKFLIPEIIYSPFHKNYFFSIMDVIMIGFMYEYLKKYKMVVKKTLLVKYARYAMYMGLMLNLVFFYFFHFYFPFFLWPGFCMIMTVVAYSVYIKEFKRLVYIELIHESMNPHDIVVEKIVEKKAYQMKILTTEESEDFKALTPAKKKYVPPPFSIKEEVEGREESPSDKIFK